ncbi:uncharacterized protein LOC133284981 [Gastrolobium bilobum]|uniref:uncharacterized protein LOC133284981 n=1 Tax=Gastrolobium bilobum TaxID=150636 RepID=UPI002AB234BB|nr:uncharacterized protein LOC133284981 [Gastrolobium bilobum]
MLGEDTYQVGYEGLHMIFFSCGKYGHRQDQCIQMEPGKQEKVIASASSPEHQKYEIRDVGAVTRDQVKEDKAFGDWMVIQRTRKNRRLKPTSVVKNGGDRSHPNVPKGHNNQVSVRSGYGVIENSSSPIKIVTALEELCSAVSNIRGNTNERGSQKPGPGTADKVKEPFHRKGVSKGRIEAPITRKARNRNVGPPPMQPPQRKDKGPIQQGLTILKRQEVGTSSLGPNAERQPPSNVILEVGTEDPQQKKEKDRKEQNILQLMRESDSYQENMILNQNLAAVRATMGPIWNCRGAAKKGFLALIRDLKFRFNISLLALLETKISGDKAARISSKFGFQKVHIQDPIGFSGGIWLMWDEVDYTPQILKSNHQLIHAKIRYINQPKVEYISIVYASPRRYERRALWKDLVDLNVDSSSLWVVMGDFNSLLDPSEKSGGGSFCWGASQDFRDCLSKCNIQDLGCKGPFFTWKRARIHERLDRVCVSEAWSTHWPNQSVLNLPFYSSDHRPILIIDEGASNRVIGTRSFEFQAAWLTDDSFGNIVSNCWNNDNDWSTNSEQFQADASHWHEYTFRALQKQKNRIQARLRGIDVRLEMYPDEGLERLQQSLWKELDVIHVREEISWFQQAKCNWMELGDRNTRYFHAVTVAKHRRNRIITMKDDDGT